MTKAERIQAALARRPVDRVPVSFWRHAPDVDHTALGLAQAMLDFQRRWDLDFIKVMSSGVYCVEDWGCRVAYLDSPNGAKQCTEHAVQSLGDWARIKPLDAGAGALGRELQALRMIREGRGGDDAPILHTVFSPMTVARKLAGDRLRGDLRAAPDAVASALDAIADTMSRHAAAALEAGADGFFFATQTSCPEVMSREESARWEIPYAQRVLERGARGSALTVLHIHGRDIYFDLLAGLPVHAINWHDRLTAPALADARRRTARVLVGGLNEAETLRRGDGPAAGGEARDAVRQVDGTGLIVAPGCVLPLAVPEHALEAVLDAIGRGPSGGRP
jgi:uroporphyrinogen decarboxylase